MNRMSASGGCPQWEVEAKRRLAVWKQQLSTARALAHGNIVVEVAASKGVNINVDGCGLRECMESSSFQEIQREAARKLSRWDSNMEIAEKVVYSSFLVSAAREAGVDVDGLRQLPMLKYDRKQDACVQVSLSCPDCVSLEKSMSEGMVGEDFSFSDSEMEGDSSEEPPLAQ